MTSPQGNSVNLAQAGQESPFSALAETHNSEPIEVMLARTKRQNIAFYGAFAMVAIIFLVALILSIIWALSGKGAYPNLDGDMIAFLLSTLKIIIAGAVGYSLRN